MLKTVAIVGLIQSLFGILLFITKRPWHFSFTFIIIWFAVIAIFLGASLLPFQVVEYFKPGIFPILFLFGPLLFLYVSSLAVENFVFKPRMFLHLLPMILVAAHRSVFNPVPIGATLANVEGNQLFYNNIYYGLLVFSMLVYWIYSLKLIFVYRKNIPNHFSNYSANNSLSWLVSVLTLFLLFFIADFSISFFDRMFDSEIRRFPVLSINLTVFTFIMIFFGINQSVIYKPGHKKPDEIAENQENEETRTARPSLTEQQTHELVQTIFQYLKSKKPYLNSEYSLQMMAEDLNISRHKLSYVINIGLQKNFYKLINELRVNEVKEMLANPEYKHYTLLGIGLECGFNSKTSFNRIFKEETGFTPTEYKKRD